MSTHQYYTSDYITSEQMGVSVNAGAEHLLIQIILFSCYILWELHETPLLNLQGLFHTLLKLLAGRIFLCRTHWAGWNDSYQVAPSVSVWAGPAKRFYLLFMFMTINVGRQKCLLTYDCLKDHVHLWPNELGSFFVPAVLLRVESAIVQVAKLMRKPAFQGFGNV